MKSLAEARSLLLSLGALDGKGITPLGQKMAELPCHPRISRMIIRASKLGKTSLACDIAALLEEKDPLPLEEYGTDLSLRVNLLRQYRHRRNLAGWQRIGQVSEAYRRMMRAAEDNEAVGSEDIGCLVAYAYPERVAMQMDRAGRYRLAGGEEVRLTNDALAAYPWLAIASVNVAPTKGERGGGFGTVFLGAAVEPEDLEELASRRDLVAWDTGRDGLAMQHEWRIGRLPLRSKPLHDAPRDLQEQVICDAVQKDGLSMLSWNEAVGALQRRVARVAEWHPELGIPDLSTQHLLASVRDWLPYYLYEEDGRLRSTGTSLRKIDLCKVLLSLVPYDLQQAIDRLAPSHIEVPTERAAVSVWTTGSEPKHPC